MNLSSLLPWRRAQPAAVAPAPDPAVADPAPDGADNEALPRGCGWFDSSHELQRGLCVRELATPDSVARELPLAGWLEWQLAS